MVNVIFRLCFYGLFAMLLSVYISLGWQMGVVHAYDNNYQTPDVWLPAIKQYVPYIDDANLITCTAEMAQDVKIPFMEYIRYISACLERIKDNA